MGWIELHKFRIFCDGAHPDPDKGRCGVNITLETTSRLEAQREMLAIGWKVSVSGTTNDRHESWLCNAAGGHGSSVGKSASGGLA